MKELIKINNEIKGYVNEATFISNKCRNKLIMLLGEEFGIEFQLENYANIDVKILENGDLEMRGDRYKTTHDIKDFSDIEIRYNNFKDKAAVLLKKKSQNKTTQNDFNNILNLFVILGIILIFIFVIYICLSSIMSGNYYNFLWLIVFIIPRFIPNLKENLNQRIDQAKSYIKRRFKK